MENLLPHIMEKTNSVLSCCELGYFSFADGMGFWRRKPSFLTSIIIRVPMRDVRDYDFMKKRRGKKVYQIILSSTSNESPLFFITHCKNVHYDSIAHTTTV